jgi:Flp pilus assembly pilin Flp
VIKRFYKDERGQDIAEYSLMLVLIGLAAILFSMLLGANISNLIDRINTTLRSAGNQIS